MPKRLGASALVLALAVLLPSPAFAHHRRHHHHHHHARHHHRRHHHARRTAPHTTPTPTPSPTPTPTPPLQPIPPCPATGSTTLASSATAYVYSLGGAVTGCVINGLPYQLGGAPPCLGSPQGVVGPVTVAGDLAAYGLHTCGVDTSESQVIVERLSDGTKVVDTAATVGTPLVESQQSVASIVLKGDGAVAWIGQISSVTGSNTTQVLKDDSGGETVLDSGPGIDPTSLTLDGSTVSWVDGGTTHTATLN